MNQMMLFDAPNGDDSDTSETASKIQTRQPAASRQPAGPRQRATRVGRRSGESHPGRSPHAIAAEEVAAFEMATPVIEPLPKPATSKPRRRRGMRPSNHPDQIRARRGVSADAPVGDAPVGDAPVGDGPVMDADSIRRSIESGESLDYTEGLNRMGDLARLVILRYELAAKRRRQSLRRQQADVDANGDV